MTEIVTVGRTNYYSARKGPHHYRVAEGKRLADTEHAWLVVKDQDSGKNYFINGDGVRRWHLPDIFQTEEERDAELRELKFRRDRRDRQARGEKVDEDAEEDAEEAKKKDQEVDVDYGARDRTAAALRPKQEWEQSSDKRRSVIKFVKSTLAPLNAQGDLDEKLFSTVSTTVCREFFHNNSDFNDSNKASLKTSALTYAKARIDEKHVKEEYRKMNAELLAKVKRLDAERKSLNQQVAEHIKTEEQQKDEIFKLRAHKQDAVLQSFKRLTRQGLVQTYWFRWKAFKDTLEAQMHVNARENKQKELLSRKEKLEEDLKVAQEDNEKLHDRVRRSEGRDVINVMLRQSGVYVMSRFYYIWKRWAEASVKERQFHEMRQQLDDCPLCKQKDVEVDRLKGRLRDAKGILNEKGMQFFQMEEEKNRAEEQSRAVQALVAGLQKEVRDAQKVASDLSRRLAWTERRLFEAEENGRKLEHEIEALQFEIMNLSDFGGGGKGGGGGQGGGGQSMSHLGGDGNNMNRTQNPLLNAEGHLGYYMGKERQGMEKRLRDITVGRAAANADRAARTLKDLDEGEPGSGLIGLAAAGTTAAPDSPSRGQLNAGMSHSIAPNVVPPPPVLSDDDDDDDPNSASARRKRKHANRRYTDESPPPPDAPYPEDLIYRETQPMGADSGNSPGRDAESPPPPPVDGADSDEDEDPELDELRKQMAEHDQETEEKENEKCEKCGFRKKLTPFCPKDGTRHFFTSLLMEPLVKAKVPTTAEEFTLSLRQTKDQADAARLPRGLPADAIPGVAYIRPNSLAAQLKQSINLNPGSFDVRSAQPQRHTKPTDIVRDPGQQNQIDDYIRHTKARAEEARQAALEGRAEGGLSSNNNEKSLMQSLRYDRQRDSLAAREREGKWGTVFNVDVEGMDGNLRMDPVFGVVHQTVNKSTPAQRMLNTHTTTPNFQTQ